MTSPSGMEDWKDKKWRIHSRRSSRRCTAASLLDRMGSTLRKLVVNTQILVILENPHDHVQHVIQLLKSSRIIFLWMFIWIIWSSEACVWRVRHQQGAVYDNEIMTLSILLSLSYELGDVICFIFKPLVCGCRLRCYMMTEKMLLIVKQ